MGIKNVEDLRDQIKTYKDKMEGEGPFTTEHAQGFYNGMEAALAIVEDRPAFFKNKDKSYCDYDLKKYPEYFV